MAGLPPNLNAPSESAGCVGAASGTIPEDAVWLSHDGESEVDFALGDDLAGTWEGTLGDYDLDLEEVFGAASFRLERPGDVVGIAARWTHAGAGPSEVWVWPDLGGSGLAWDRDHPLTCAVREVGTDEEGLWIEYALDEPVRVGQPEHVFAGYHRVPGDGRPDLLVEDTWAGEEPYRAAAWFPRVDEGLEYGGMLFPWYVWQVRVAVLYDDEIDPDDRLFAADVGALAAGRASWGDWNSDGDDDLMAAGPTLYDNDGGGVFTDVTVSAIPDGVPRASGGVWGDYDNDGCLDWFGQGGGDDAGDVLLRNTCAGRFEDATAGSGLDDVVDEVDCNDETEPEHAPTEGAAWLDLDADGWIDLFLANHVCRGGADDGRAYDDRLWHNEGDGTFSDWSDGLGIDGEAGSGAAPADYDRDGDVDLYVANDVLGRNRLFRNDGGSLVDIAVDAGVAGTLEPDFSAWGSSIGAAWGDLDQDGDFDLVLANQAQVPDWLWADRSAIFVQRDGGTFEDEGALRGLVPKESHAMPLLLDADNDGDLDLYMSASWATRTSDFYLNDGAGDFTRATYESGTEGEDTWGAAAADVDMDGDLDMVSGALYRNRTEGGHWLQVGVLGGPLSNASGIGAVVEVDAGDLVLIRSVSGGSASSVQDSLVQHFGLWDVQEVERVRVAFVGAPQVELEDVEADQRIWVREDGSWERAWSRPR